MAFWREYYRERPERLQKQFGPFVLYLNRNHYKFTDPRDILYAHRGICEKGHLLKPDYSKPVAQVYTEFWREVLERIRDTNFLTYVEDGSCSENRGKTCQSFIQMVLQVVSSLIRSLRGLPWSKTRPLPSWVPDFQVKLEPDSLTAHYCTIPREGSAVPLEGFDVSKGAPPKQA